MALHELPNGAVPADLAASIAHYVPPGASAALHALTEHHLRIAIDAHGATSLTHAEELPERPPAPLLLAVEIHPSDTNPERTAAGLLDAIEPLTVSSAALETRLHLDLVTPTRRPSAHAFIMNKRQPHMTRDEFYWYYRTNHAALARSLQPAFIRYTTHRVLHNRGPHFADGVTVQEYDDLASFHKHIATRTRPDDDAFVDIANFVGQVDYWIGEKRWDV